MGNDIPPDLPPLEPDKWYCVNIDAYQGGGPPYNCSMNFVVNFNCVQDGEWIQDYIDMGGECVGGWELCAFTGYSAQKIGSWTGPYDTYEDAIEDCTNPI